MGETLRIPWPEESSCDEAAPNVGKKISFYGTFKSGGIVKDTYACRGVDDAGAYRDLVRTHKTDVERLSRHANVTGKASDWDELAALLLDRGDPQLALRAIRKASSSDKSGMRGYEEARALLGIGRREEAARILSRDSGRDVRARFQSQALGHEDAKGVEWSCWRDGYQAPKAMDAASLPLDGRNVSGLSLLRVKVSDFSAVRADLTNAKVGCGDLTGANLREATLVRIDGMSVKLDGADLRGAEADDANLTNASLVAARLERLTAKRVNFASAKLDGADLRMADLAGANLRRASLVGARLEGAKLDEATYDCKTVLPDGIDRSKLKFDPRTSCQ